MRKETDITKAFRELRQLGYFAKQNHSCCAHCGHWEVPEDKRDKYVFYHMQDKEHLDKRGTCWLSWEGDGKEIVGILHKHNLSPEWNGDKDFRIKITLQKYVDCKLRGERGKS